MGGIISDLKDKSETFILVSRWFPSTKTCRSCGNKQEILLSDRIFQCRVCGHSEDRDIHSAKNILQEAFRVMRDSEHVKSPVELVTPVLSHLGQSKSSAVKQEAIAL
jgi:transposase